MPISKNPIKNVLYRIMSQRKDQDRTRQDIMQAVKDEMSNSAVKLNYTGGGDQENYEYDNWNNPARDFNKLYLTGEAGEIQELPANTPGFSYSNYIKKTGYTPKTYKGEILPDELVVHSSYRPALESLVGKHTYANQLRADYDDVAHYIQKIGRDDQGNLEMQASDIWDFQPNDWKNIWKTNGKTKNKLISQLGAHILDAAGKPFILRDNAKIRFTDNADEVTHYLIENLGLPRYTGVDKSGTPNFNLPEITVTPTGSKYQTADWHVESKSLGGILNYFDYFK